MRRHGVVLKLFIVTSVMILIVFSLVLLAEGLFFERFYRTSKIQTIERNMNQFVDQYKQSESNERSISPLIGAFMNHNDASTAILNNRLERTTLNPYFLEIQDDTKTKSITILISTNGMTMDAIPQGIEIGDNLVVDGIFMDEKDTIMHPVVIQQTESDLEDGLERVKGKITNLLLPEQRSYNPLYQDTLIDDALLDLKLEAEQSLSTLQNGSLVQMEWSDKWSGVQYAVLIRSLSEDGNRYLMVMTSLQPVGEAVGILKQYFVYMAPIILILVIILSFIYSKIVSRPLVMLSRSAVRLANLDFTIQPQIHSKDEFGELSRNMIALSRNLDTALKDLTDANMKLQEDIEEKQRSEQLRKELIANISHELKTPLGIVKGFAEGLQDGVATDKKDRYLAMIVNETDRMNALIMDMLELSKFEVKAVRLHPRSISMTNLIQNMVDSFAQQLESKHLQIKVNLEEEELFVEADPRRIEQVVLNLLSNAIRYAVENSVIAICIGRTNAGKVNTVIENIGPHIAEGDLSRIWDQFYRVERSRDRRSGGTGLGLTIVKHILELHESEFGVVNTNSGVAFSFKLNESRGEINEQ